MTLPKLFSPQRSHLGAFYYLYKKLRKQQETFMAATRQDLTNAIAQITSDVTAANQAQTDAITALETAITNLKNELGAGFDTEVAALDAAHTALAGQIAAAQTVTTANTPAPAVPEPAPATEAPASDPNAAPAVTIQ